MSINSNLSSFDSFSVAQTNSTGSPKSKTSSSSSTPRSPFVPPGYNPLPPHTPPMPEPVCMVHKVIKSEGQMPDLQLPPPAKISKSSSPRSALIARVLRETPSVSSSVSGTLVIPPSLPGHHISELSSQRSSMRQPQQSRSSALTSSSQTSTSSRERSVPIATMTSSSTPHSSTHHVATTLVSSASSSTSSAPSTAPPSSTHSVATSSVGITSALPQKSTQIPHSIPVSHVVAAHPYVLFDQRRVLIPDASVVLPAHDYNHLYIYAYEARRLHDENQKLKGKIELLEAQNKKLIEKNQKYKTKFEEMLKLKLNSSSSQPISTSTTSEVHLASVPSSKASSPASATTSGQLPLRRTTSLRPTTLATGQGMPPTSSRYVETAHSSLNPSTRISPDYVVDRTRLPFATTSSSSTSSSVNSGLPSRSSRYVIPAVSGASSLTSSTGSVATSDSSLSSAVSSVSSTSKILTDRHALLRSGSSTSN